MAQEPMTPEGFKTSLFGFNRDDVLAMIEDLSARNTQALNESEARSEELEKHLDEITGRYNELLKSSRSLDEQLQAEQKRSKDLKQKNDDLEDKYVYSQEMVNTLKVEWERKDEELKRLSKEKESFNRVKMQVQQEKVNAERRAQEAQKEITRLQAELAEAKSKLVEKPEEIGEEAATRQIRVQAELEARKLVEDTRLRVKSAESHASEELEQARRKMAENARNLVVGVEVLRGRLKNLDGKVDEATRELENCTGAIYSALEETQVELEKLGVEMVQLAEKAPKEEPEQPKQEKEQVPVPEEKPAPEKSAEAEPLPEKAAVQPEQEPPVKVEEPIRNEQKEEVTPVTIYLPKAKKQVAREQETPISLERLMMEIDRVLGQKK